MKVNNLAKSIIVQEYETQFKNEFYNFLNSFAFGEFAIFGRKKQNMISPDIVNLNKDLKLVDIIFNHYLNEHLYEKDFILKKFGNSFIFFGIFDLKLNEDESNPYFLFYHDNNKNFIFLNNDEIQSLFGKKIFIDEQY